MLISRLLPLAGALLLAGCASMAPSYERPAAPLPAQYGAGLAATGADAAALDWRGYFTDPALQRLIEQALAHNHDQRVAVLRVQEAQAAYGVQRSARYPTLGLSAEAARARTPADLSLTGSAVTGSQLQAGLGISNWEIDFWGRIASLSEAAKQSFLATDAARRATTLSLIAQVADTYLGLRELDERLRLAQGSAASQRESLRIFTRRFDVGSASRLELTQVQTLVTQADSLVVQIQQQRDQQAHALDLLLGSPAELPPMPAPAPAQAEAAWQLPPLQVGLPSELLLQRPDIVAAELTRYGVEVHRGDGEDGAFDDRLLAVGAPGCLGRRRRPAPGRGPPATRPLRAGPAAPGPSRSAGVRRRRRARTRPRGDGRRS